MSDWKTLESVTDDPYTGGGIFTALQTLDVPWQDDDIALPLDIEYYGNFSGNKIIAPLVEKLLVNDEIPAASIETLANIAFSLFGRNWAKEWATYSAVYDPIKNYDMTETMTDDETVTDYGKTHTRTDNLRHVTTPNLTTTDDMDTFGFNSSTAVHADAQTQTATGTNTDTDTGTQTGVDTGSDTTTRNYTLTRSGNIGVTTSQQMLQSERDLWIWNYFFLVVFPDIDKLMTIQVY